MKCHFETLNSVLKPQMPIPIFMFGLLLTIARSLVTPQEITGITGTSVTSSSVNTTRFIATSVCRPPALVDIYRVFKILPYFKPLGSNLCKNVVHLKIKAWILRKYFQLTNKCFIELYYRLSLF